MVTNQEHLIPEGLPKEWKMSNLEDFGRIRLSCNFFMRDMLYSEVASRDKIMNVPDDPVWAVQVGTKLCNELLEPLHTVFGHVSIRSAFRSVAVNDCGNTKYGNLASTQRNYARHVWDKLDNDNRKRKGATACIVIPWFVRYLERNPDQSWKAMAWWIHDHLNYCEMKFFSNRKFNYSAFNLRWSNIPTRRIQGPDKNPGEFPRAGEQSVPGRNRLKYPGFPKRDPLGEHYAE